MVLLGWYAKKLIILSIMTAKDARSAPLCGVPKNKIPALLVTIALYFVSRPA